LREGGRGGTGSEVHVAGVDCGDRVRADRQTAGAECRLARGEGFGADWRGRRGCWRRKSSPCPSACPCPARRRRRSPSLRLHRPPVTGHRPLFSRHHLLRGEAHHPSRIGFVFDRQTRSPTIQPQAAKILALIPDWLRFAHFDICHPPSDICHPPFHLPHSAFRIFRRVSSVRSSSRWPADW